MRNEFRRYLYFPMIAAMTSQELIVSAVSLYDLDARAPALASSPACAGDFAATAPSRPPVYISPQRFTYPCNRAVAPARLYIPATLYALHILATPPCAQVHADASAAPLVAPATPTVAPQLLRWYCSWAPKYPSVSTPSTPV
jgi:hypothetical protein